MKNKKYIIFLTALMIILTVISAVFIIINGKTYKLKISNLNFQNNNIDDVVINFEKGHIAEIVDKRINNDKLEIVIHSLNEGNDYINIEANPDFKFIERIFVHKSGIITINTFFGDFRGDKIIPISICIWIIAFLCVFIKKYRMSTKESLYKYKNISYVGLIIFFSIVLINQIASIKNYSGFDNTIRDVINITSVFSMVLLPIAFLTSIGVFISNIVLLKKEGKNWRNLLGIMLGLLLCVLTIIPEILNNVLQSSMWINVQNSLGFAHYFETFIETAIYIVVAYLESILLGTIILSKKAAKKVPEFNKDYIIILGCKIEEDGSLTKLLKGRVDRAIEFSKMQKEKTGKDIVFVPSGGKGKDEIISEAIAMKNYLIENGIEEKQIIIEDESKSTYENIKNSNNIIKKKMKNAQIALSTTNYHVFRAGVIANSQNINVEGIGAKTKIYFWINAFIREFIATLYSEKKKHILTIIVLILLSIFAILTIYFSENI